MFSLNLSPDCLQDVYTGFVDSDPIDLNSESPLSDGVPKTPFNNGVSFRGVKVDGASEIDLKVFLLGDR